MIPLFPELRPYLEDVDETAESGATFIITKYRQGSNLRTQLGRIVKRAGLKPWPRITHNLRASRATELAAAHPAHVAAAFLGHNAMVAQKHYLIVTDSDFQKALQTSSTIVTPASTKGGAESGARSAQKPAQQARASIRSDSQLIDVDKGNTAVIASRGDLQRKPAEKMAEVHGNRTHRSYDFHKTQRF